ncbi:MAG: nicotinate phosphoribosyltransferase [Succinivibrionaceae bacterium]|nr:nicotinate phosphoribosyltransferase [Succinivibrionaceae bacterium]
MSQSDRRNLTLMMDLYEMTMSNGYFLDRNPNDRVCFDVFYRHNPDQGGFAIFAGLEQVIEYIENLHFDGADIDYLRTLGLFDPGFLEYLRGYRFTGDIDAFPEGTIIYPNEPVLTVTASPIDAQLIETAVLAEINHQSLIATKAQRIVRAARGHAVSDFGARRAHNMDAAVYGARAAYIGGVVGTATVMAGQMFNIPVNGTMAHSWVMYFEDEFTAFRKYAETYPKGCILLIDTYDVLKSGIPNAIRTAHEVLEPMGERLRGVRIDSGDLAYFSKEMRRMLDEAGLEDCMIAASNSLDEYTISSILDQGGRIDSFGVGERLITAKSDPVFGAVYKLAAVERGGAWTPKIKISATVEKITNPGLKRVFRVFGPDGKARADLITLRDERLDFTKPVRYVDPLKPWRNRSFEDCTARELQVPAIRGGKRASDPVDISQIRDYVRRQLTDEIWQEEQRFENPHQHHLDMSPDYYDMKMTLLNEESRD